MGMGLDKAILGMGLRLERLLSMYVTLKNWECMGRPGAQCEMGLGCDEAIIIIYSVSMQQRKYAA
jgi:hypothetical protein